MIPAIDRQGPKVALVKTNRRRDGAAEALALLSDEIAAIAHDEVVIKPNLVSHRNQLASTHVDILSATVDFLLAAGARTITIAEGASDASEGFEAFGYRDVLRGLPVRFFDVNRDETEWDEIELRGIDGSTRVARISRTLARARSRVSLALCKTHVNTLVTFSLKNMLSCIHPEDRTMMHGYAPGRSAWTGWRGAAVKFLKGDDLAVRATTRLLGRLKRIKFRLEGKDRSTNPRPLSAADAAFLRSSATLGSNLVALSRRVKPHFSVVDGFIAMHREGPRHGTPYPLGAMIAGNDAVAVDAVAAAVMGFDPFSIDHIAKIHNEGLGSADLEAIEIVGDSLATVRRELVPHSHAAILGRIGEVEPIANLVPAPHFERSIDRVDAHRSNS